MPWRNQNQPTAIERVIAGICYPTAGIAGIIYIILSKNSQVPFFRFHFLQSIILAIIFLLLGWAQNILMMFVNVIISSTLGGDPARAQQVFGVIAMGADVVMRALYLIPIYGMICAFLGKLAEVPLISNVVRQQMR